MKKSKLPWRPDYTRVTVKGAAYKKMIDLMSWTGENTPQETVAASLDARWQHLKEAEVERLALLKKVKTQ